MAKYLIIFGISIAILGLGLLLAAKAPGFGSLPGDIHTERDGLSCFAPIGTMILLSLLLTLILNISARLFK